MSGRVWVGQQGREGEAGEAPAEPHGTRERGDTAPASQPASAALPSFDRLGRSLARLALPQYLPHPGEWPRALARHTVPDTDPPPGAGRAPHADTRRLRRLPTEGGIRPRAYRGPLGLGPNIGLRVLDGSPGGARVVLSEALPAGHEMEGPLEHPFQGGLTSL